MRLSLPVLLKILLGGLLLGLLLAVGTEVVALHRGVPPEPRPPTAPVVVRKSATAPVPPKTVRPVVARPPRPGGA